MDKTEEKYSTIMYSRKILLFQNSKLLVKKDDNDDFDIFMGCYDGAEVSELEDSFIFHQLGPVIDKIDICFIGMTVL